MFNDSLNKGPAARGSVSPIITESVLGDLEMATRVRADAFVPFSSTYTWQERPLAYPRV